jgi:hypothetical protein
VRIPVYVEAWQIECCMDPPAVGSVVSWPLVFVTRADADRDEGAGLVELDLVAWSMGERALAPSTGPRHGVWLGDPDRVPGLALYWAAPYPAQGRTRVVGYIHEDHHGGVPEGFPEARGVVRRIQVETARMIEAEPRLWRPTADPPSYEDVALAPSTFRSVLNRGSVWTAQRGILVDLEIDAGQA